MKAEKFKEQYTFADYLNWEGRWELINGIPYAMSPLPSPNHQSLAGEIHALLLQKINRCKSLNCKVYQPIDIKIDNRTVVGPDLLIVCKPIKKNYLDFPPNLVVEILSPSTRLKDLNLKYSYYEKFGITYYVIVDPDQVSVSSYQLEKGEYKEKMDNKFQLEDVCTINVDFEKIFN